MKTVSYRLGLEGNTGATIFTKHIDIPDTVSCLTGISVYATNQTAQTYSIEMELILNDDRDTVSLPILPSGSNAEIHNEKIDVKVPILENTKHMIVLRGIANVKLTLFFD